LSGIDILSAATIDMEAQYIHSLVQNPENGHYFIIPTDHSFDDEMFSGSNKILVLNASFELIETIGLEDFYFEKEDKSGYIKVNASAENVYYNANHHQLVVLSRPDSAIYNPDWGIEIINW